MDAFLSITETIKNIIFNNVLVFILMGGGVFFSIVLKFPQFRWFKEMFKSLMPTKNSTDGITPFQAFATTLGARVGVGNIAGVATAIYYGGPGAVFWIWAFGLFATATALVEAVLGQAYKIKKGDEFFGGPAYYIERGLKWKPLAKVFAVLVVIGLGLLMPGVQMDAISSTMSDAYSINTTVVTIVATALIGVIIWGGIKRIGKIAEKLAPFMCAIYLILGIIVIVQHANVIGSTFATIFSSAFGTNAVFGGILGSAVSWGVRRGIFSTDAGYGAGATMAAAADCEHPAKQGLIQALSIYLSIFIVCTISALIILLSGMYNVTNEATGAIIVNNVPRLEAGALWVQTALESISPPIWESRVLSVIIALFAITTLLGYYYQVESNMRYLFKNFGKIGTTTMRIIFIFGILIGGLVNSYFIWNIMDIGMALMAWVNMIVILLMTKKVYAIMQDYEQQKKSGIINPIFDPSLFGIEDDTGAWAQYSSKKEDPDTVKADTTE